MTHFIIAGITAAIVWIIFGCSTRGRESGSAPPPGAWIVATIVAIIAAYLIIVTP